MNLWRRRFHPREPRKVAAREHATLGTLAWDPETEFWLATLADRDDGRPVRVFLWGDPDAGPSPEAIDLVLPCAAAGLTAIVDAARAYLASELSANAKRPVASDELAFLDLTTHAGKSPYLLASFEWPEQPDWLIRVSLEGGQPQSWGFDD
jgi:hypothetical protein